MDAPENRAFRLEDIDGDWLVVRELDGGVELELGEATAPTGSLFILTEERWPELRTAIDSILSN